MASSFLRHPSLLLCWLIASSQALAQEPAPPSDLSQLPTPETTFTSVPPSITNETSATFSFISSEPNSTFECSLDKAPFSECPSPRFLGSLSEGAHTFQVRALDAAGNVDPTPASHSWTVDTTPPDTLLALAPPAVTASTSASFTFSSNDPGASLQCSLDGEPFRPCSSPVAYTGLSQGVHTFEVRARDTAGNVDYSPASYSWTVDTSYPETTLTSTPQSVTASTSATFTFFSTAAVVTFECSLDGSTFTACSSPVSYSALPDGAHTFRVRARDPYGSVDSTPAGFTWTVDTTAPPTSITSAPPALTGSTSARFEFSSEDPSASFECSLDGASFAICSSPAAHASLSNGVHTFEVRARDAAGNVDPTPASYSWTVDTDVPDTLLTSAPPEVTDSTSATFAFSSDPPGATFECSLDGAAYTACANLITYTSLTGGLHVFLVRARGGTGKVDPSPANYSWTVNAPAPDTLLTSAPLAVAPSSSATFAFSSSTPRVTFECSLDGAAFRPCTNPATYTSLSEGAHTFLVRALDSTGKVDPTPASHSWLVDTIPPAAPVLLEPTRGALLSSDLPILSGTAEAGSTVKVSLDGTASGTVQAANDGSWTLRPPSPLAAGAHDVSLTATDAAGNTSPPATSTFTIDEAAVGPPDSCMGCSSTSSLAAWPWLALLIGLASSRRPGGVRGAGLRRRGLRGCVGRSG